MAVFNELAVSDDHRNDLLIQFRAGIVWQYVYKLGEPLKFESGDPMKNGRHYIYGIASVADGWAHYRLTLDDGAIVDYEPISEVEYEEHY